ncbi:MAG: ATP-binding protein [Campylobacterota bacterium]|nr:ATP-binding protein [Campylobacterota bacterium]
MSIKFDNKTIVVTFALIFISIIASYINYIKFDENHKHIMNESIIESMSRVKLDIQKADKIVDIIFNQRKELFLDVSNVALQKLRDNPSMKLSDLKLFLKRTTLKNSLKELDIELFLINNQNIIYDTTYKKDLDLNMTNFSGAKEYINLAKQNSKKTYLSQPSYDILSQEHKIYTYSLLDKKSETVLEIGFLDNSINELKKEMYKFTIHNSSLKDIEIFADYGNYIINLSKEQNSSINSKKEYISSLKKEISKRENRVVKEVSLRNKEQIFIEKIGAKSFRIIYSPVLESKVSKTKNKHYVVKLTLDTTMYIEHVNDMKNLFFASISILLIFIIVYILFLKKSILSPLNRHIDMQKSEIEQKNYFIDSLMQNIPIPIFYKDVDGKYAGVNDEFEKILGFKKDEIIGKSVYEIASKEIAQIWNQKDKELLSNPHKTQIYEYVVKNRATQELRDVVFYKNVYYDADDNIAGIIGAIMDITQKKRDEDKLLQYSINLEHKVEDEVEKNRRKDKKALDNAKLAQMGEMLSMIAHQWRQPLGAIGGATAAIQSKIELEKYDLNLKDDRIEFQKYLQTTLRSIGEYVEFLSKTIDDFRNFFKKDKEKSVTVANVVVQKALGIVQKSMQNNNIHFDIEYKIDDDDRIELYQNELIQVILNLLKNSEDNFKDIKQDKKQITIKTYKEDALHVISVKDNGGGVPKDIVNKIFDPYFSTKLEKNGTGLGLYISKVIIEEHHNGTIELLNSHNGVEFIIKLKGIV